MTSQEKVKEMPAESQGAEMHLSEADNIVIPEPLVDGEWDPSDWPEVVDPDEQMTVVQQIMTSTSVEDILNPTKEVRHLRVNLNQTFLLSGFRVLKSKTYEGKMYMAIFGITEEGEPVIYTTGGENVMAQVQRLNQLDALPVWVEAIEKKTNNGFNVLWLQASKPKEF